MITYERRKNVNHLDVIGVLEDNNLIVSRASLEKFEHDVDLELAHYKVRVNRLEQENRDLKDRLTRRYLWNTHL